MQALIARVRAGNNASVLLAQVRGAGLDSLRKAYRRAGVRDAMLSWRLHRTVRAHAGLLDYARTAAFGRSNNAVVILPTDPVLLTSSRGDEAMYSSALQAIESKLPGSQVFVLTLTEQADRAARELGMVPVRVSALEELRECLDAILALKPRHVVLLGADGMDGAHDPHFSFSLLANADLCARAGIASTLTGFSVSLTADARLWPHFANVHRNLNIFVRDPVSLQRFQKGCPGLGHLVADLAFTLAPSALTERAREVTAWAEARRAAGDLVVGLNVHPLLYGGMAQRDMVAHVREFTRKLLAALDGDRRIAVITIAHDFRGASADANCHRVMAPVLNELLGQRYLDLSDPLRASEIKGILGSVDAVITGRMHLAIAALGRGAPILGLNYRDKMEGLAQHFEQHDCVVSNADFLDVDPAVISAAAFLRDLDAHRTAVGDRLAHVVQLAQKNFERLDVVA